MMTDTYFQDKTVLVTGAAGFVGSHLVDALLAKGADVIGVDNFITGRRQNIAHLKDTQAFTFIEADASQSPSQYLADVLPERKIDAVLHFASPASPPLYQRSPVETYLVNSIGTHNLLQFLLEHNPEARLLFASTSEVYGDPEEHPQPETYFGNVNPNGPRSCYDEAKRLGETICGVHQRDFDLDVRIVRIFNTYGPRMNPADGRIIPNFVTQALKGEKLTIYGDGSQTRSYCYVDDLVNGILIFLAGQDLAGQTINLGNPDEYTVLQTAQIISKLIAQHQHQPEPSSDGFEYYDMPKDDPTRRKPDISRAQKVLAWSPQVTFEQGMAKTIDYYAR